MEQSEYDTLIQERFAELPEAVQEAVTDARVEKKLRTLAAKHKLHLDQWVLLENEIMLTLLGLEDPQDMAKNIAKEVEVSTEIAQELVNDIAREVFKPIREQMQGRLDESASKRKVVLVSQKQQDNKKTPTDTLAYKPGESSANRRDVQEDPYRESID